MEKKIKIKECFLDMEQWIMAIKKGGNICDNAKKKYQYSLFAKVNKPKFSFKPN